MLRDAKLLLVVLGITISSGLGLAAVSLAFILPGRLEPNIAGLLCILWVLALGAVLLGGLLTLALSLALAVNARCPECGKTGTIALVRKRIIAQKKCYGLVTRDAHSRSSTAKGRTTWGSTSYKERVPVIRTTYLMYYECEECQASWTEEKVVEREDFEIERE